MPLTAYSNPRFSVAMLLANCVGMGLRPESPAEAQQWFELLDNCSSQSWTLQHVAVGLGTLARLNNYTPTPEVRALILEAATLEALQAQDDARIMLEISGKWGVALPAEAQKRLELIRDERLGRRGKTRTRQPYAL
ncbi:hypothetical protein HYH02_015132 [Chlamydomonas schloesseri]|uniref:Uncharacterized protein n=1 Tax=Chlamydomonas schloesseri TaxID=2026947 RepID=A0A835VR70_9CHLO|nr:hypothetical protein HYH02_015132 [Chlamydomonas schloesseri]|eukprot:KAG2424750.1 hypothetical protein HYH02_015132 [Chlamydomonas schloesseri]